MASAQNYDYNFPYFPPTQPHNSQSPPKFPPSHNPPNKPISRPPPPKFPVPAPPPRHLATPPPPAAKPPSHSTPPPSHPNYPPPPSHIVPTPSPPPGHHSHTVIVVIFVSLGGLFFLALLSVALCCFIKKKKKKKSVQKTDIAKIDEHLKIKKAVIEGPHGPQSVILSVEDDIHIQEEIRKNESYVGKGGGSNITSVETQPQVLDIEPSTSVGSHHHHPNQNTT